MLSERTMLAGLAPATTVGLVLFSLAWLILGRISTGFTLFGQRITPYNWLAQPVSGLGLGNTGPAMNLAFVVTALVMAAGLVGSMARLTVLSSEELWIFGGMLLLCPLGTALCGLFTLERFMPHFIGFLLAMATPVLSFAALGWRLVLEPSHLELGVLLIVAAAVTLALLILYFRTFDPETSGRGEGMGGLTQRLLITEVFAVLAALGWMA